MRRYTPVRTQPPQPQPPQVVCAKACPLLRVTCGHGHLRGARDRGCSAEEAATTLEVATRAAVGRCGVAAATTTVRCSTALHGARRLPPEPGRVRQAPRRQTPRHPGARPGILAEPGPERSDRSLRHSSGDTLPTLGWDVGRGCGLLRTPLPLLGLSLVAALFVVRTTGRRFFRGSCWSLSTSGLFGGVWRWIMVAWRAYGQSLCVCRVLHQHARAVRTWKPGHSSCHWYPAVLFGVFA